MTPWQNRVTELTRRMADDMKVRNYSQRTIDAYTYHVGKFAHFLGKSPLGNRSHPGQELRWFVTGVLCAEGINEEVEGVSFLLPTGFDDGQETFHEATAMFALSAEGEVLPDHRVAQRAFGSVVRRFDILAIDEHPQIVEVVQQFRAGRCCRTIRAAGTFGQNLFDFPLQTCHLTFETATSDFLIANAMPVMKQSMSAFQKTLTNSAGCSRSQAYLFKITFQMSPAPLMSPQPVIRLCTIAGGDSLKIIAQKFLDHAGGFGQSNAKHRECCCYDCPDPGILILLSSGCLIRADGILFGDLLHKLFARSRNGVTGLLLVFHDEPDADWVIQQRLTEQRDSAFALSKHAHQQRCEGHQPRAALTRRHARWKLRAGLSAAAGTRQSMQLVFREVQTNLRKLSDLVTNRGRIRTRQY